MNKGYLRYSLIFILVLILQTTIIKHIQILYWKPDLVLVVLVIFSMQYGKNYGSTAGFIIGVLSDLISGGLLGLGALTKTLTGFSAGLLTEVFPERSRFVFTLLICGFLHDGLFFLVNTLGKNVPWRVILFVYIIPNLFYTALVGTFIYYLFGKWLKGHE